MNTSCEFSASMMNRLIPCPGSWKICSDFPERSGSNQRGDEAITARWVISNCLKTNQHPHIWFGKNPVNDQIVDKEMVECVDRCMKQIQLTHKGDHLDSYIDNELKVRGFKGTPVYLAYDQGNKKITIFDLKYGFVNVDVFENWQLISYFWLWWYRNRDLPVDQVDFHICQPRSYQSTETVKKWSTTFHELVRGYFPKIHEILSVIDLSNAPTLIGKHCQHCSAIVHCKTNLETCLNIVNIAGSNCTNNPDNWELGKQLEIFEHTEEILKQRVNVLRTIGEARLKKGQVIPGYRMAPSRGHRVWKITDGEALEIGVPYQKLKLVTPRQAELAGVSRESVEEHTVTKTKMNFVKENIRQRTRQLFGLSGKMVKHEL